MKKWRKSSKIEKHAQLPVIIGSSMSYSVNIIEEVNDRRNAFKGAVNTMASAISADRNRKSTTGGVEIGMGVYAWFLPGRINLLIY